MRVRSRATGGSFAALAATLVRACPLLRRRDVEFAQPSLQPRRGPIELSQLPQRDAACGALPAREVGERIRFLSRSHRSSHPALGAQMIGVSEALEQRLECGELGAVELLAPAFP